MKIKLNLTRAINDIRNQQKKLLDEVNRLMAYYHDRSNSSHRRAAAQAQAMEHAKAYDNLEDAVAKIQLCQGGS